MRDVNPLHNHSGYLCNELNPGINTSSESYAIGLVHAMVLVLVENR